MHTERYINTQGEGGGRGRERKTDRERGEGGEGGGERESGYCYLLQLLHQLSSVCREIFITSYRIYLSSSLCNMRYGTFFSFLLLLFIKHASCIFMMRDRSFYFLCVSCHYFY